MLRYFFLLSSLVLIFTLLDRTTPSMEHFVIPSFLTCIVTYGLFNFNQYSKVQKWILLYLCISLLNQIIAYYFGLYFRSSYEVLHVYVITQLVILVNIYAINLKIKKLAFAIIFLVGVIFLFNSIYFNTISRFPSFNVVLLSAVLITLSLFQFRHMILTVNAQKLESQPVFWFNLGTFIFYAFGFFLFGFLSVIQHLPNWMFTILFASNILLYLTYFIALLLKDQPKPNQNDPIS